MAPKHHPTPLSGGDRKALSKELVKSRAMTGILAERSREKRRVGEALIREADNLACQSWNERCGATAGRRDRAGDQRWLPVAGGEMQPVPDAAQRRLGCDQPSGHPGASARGPP
jgi:hypothetical protein